MRQRIEEARLDDPAVAEQLAAPQDFLTRAERENLGPLTEQRAAARYLAKKALLSLLPGLGFLDVEIVTRQSLAPEFRILRRPSPSKGEIFLSLSHTPVRAAAFVAVEGGP